MHASGGVAVTFGESAWPEAAVQRDTNKFLLSWLEQILNAFPPSIPPDVVALNPTARTFKLPTVPRSPAITNTPREISVSAATWGGCASIAVSPSRSDATFGP